MATLKKKNLKYSEQENAFVQVNKKYADYLLDILPIYSYVIHFRELCIYVPVEKVKEIIFFLRDHTLAQYKLLTEITAVDYPARGQFRFDVVYMLLSTRFNARLKVKVSVDSTTAVPSITSIYKNANWSEREVFDMFGITFKDHPDLRRILTDYGFTGFPLRKDFPLTGFVEVRYDDTVSHIVYEPVQLAQIGYGFSGQRITKV